MQVSSGLTFMHSPTCKLPWIWGGGYTIDESIGEYTSERRIRGYPTSERDDGQYTTRWQMIHFQVSSRGSGVKLQVGGNLAIFGTHFWYMVSAVQ